MLGGVSAVPSLGHVEARRWLCKLNGQIKPHGHEQHRLEKAYESQGCLLETIRGYGDPEAMMALAFRLVPSVGRL